MGEKLRVTVMVDSDELREWAGRHADAGHHGVAEVLYRAANEAESITEEHDARVASEAAERALREAAEEMRASKDRGHWNLRVGGDPDHSASPDAWLEYRADAIRAEREGAGGGES